MRKAYSVQLRTYGHGCNTQNTYAWKFDDQRGFLRSVGYARDAAELYHQPRTSTDYSPATVTPHTKNQHEQKYGYVFGRSKNVAMFFGRSENVAMLLAEVKM